MQLFSYFLLLNSCYSISKYSLSLHSVTVVGNIQRNRYSHKQALYERVLYLKIISFNFQGLTEDELYETLNVLSNVKKWNNNDLGDSTCLFDKQKIAHKIPRATFVYLCREMKAFLNEDLRTG